MIYYKLYELSYKHTIADRRVFYALSVINVLCEHRFTVKIAKFYVFSKIRSELWVLFLFYDKLSKIPKESGHEPTYEKLLLLVS